MRISNKKGYKFFLSFILLLSPFIVKALNDSIYKAEIKTVQIYKKGSELSVPVIVLNTGEVLSISFDDLSGGAKNYYYKLVHCTYEWVPDNLSYTEYLDGFETNPVKNRQISTNTSIAYHHYSFELPNEDQKFLISGNYFLYVFEENDESKIIFTRRIYVVEPASMIDFKLIRAQLPKYMQRYQQFQLRVKPLIEDYADIREEVKVLAYRNSEPHTKRKLSATYLDNGMIVFDDMDSCVFEGGNEYRNFDIKSIKYQSPRIKSMSYIMDTFNVWLYDDIWRIKKPYLSDNDLNGKFFIENSRGIDKNTDGEYVKVHFSLPSEFIPDGTIHIYGALTDWKLDNTSQMDYNFQLKAYTRTILLKQGYYNYCYVFYNKDFSVIDMAFIESNHFETENEYQVFVYYSGVSSRYDRLIGFKSAGTQTNNLK